MNKAGRPRTDRERHSFQLTEQEAKVVSHFVDIARRKGADYARDLLKRVAALQAAEEIENNLK